MKPGSSASNGRSRRDPTSSPSTGRPNVSSRRPRGRKVAGGCQQTTATRADRACPPRRIALCGKLAHGTGLRLGIRIAIEPSRRGPAPFRRVGRRSAVGRGRGEVCSDVEYRHARSACFDQAAHPTFSGCQRLAVEADLVQKHLESARLSLDQQFGVAHCRHLGLTPNPRQRVRRLPIVLLGLPKADVSARPLPAVLTAATLSSGMLPFVRAGVKALLQEVIRIWGRANQSVDRVAAARQQRLRQPDFAQTSHP